jgi:hypothetical protein
LVCQSGIIGYSQGDFSNTAAYFDETAYNPPHEKHRFYRYCRNSTQARNSLPNIGP